MEHWTQILANISLWEFVLLAALTFGQWLRHRIRGAGWAALAFGIIGGISVVAKVDPSIVTNETAVKVLIAVLMLVPYCLFQFAGASAARGRWCSTPRRPLTIAVIAFTFTLQYVPEPGAPPPPDFVAYRLTFCAQWAFLFSYVVIRLFLAGTDQPRIAKYRMRLLALATAGLELQVVVAALGISGTSVQFADELVTVIMGVLFLGALVLPGFVRSFLGRHEDAAFRRGMTELVTAGGPKQVAEGLLPHVCALVGASRAALLEPDGTPLAQYPPVEDPDEGERDGTAASGPSRGGMSARATRRRRTASGCSLSTAKPTSSSSPSAPSCPTSAATSWPSSTSWPTWSGWPWNVPKWPSRWRTRPPTTP